MDTPVTSGRRPAGCLKLVGWFLGMRERLRRDRQVAEKLH